MLVVIALSMHAQAQSLLVEKQRFEMPSFTFFNGKTISNVTVGWESYGELNAAKDNVILITHYFTGNSHAAGKYHPDDPAPGYWDAIIGPGKAIDTDRFFVISVDSLANLGVHDPKVITTGPASINPTTGKPYGLAFPVITMRDLVNVQKALLESLGIQQLYAVAGPSMGSMQAIEWASAYPAWIPRLISVIGAAHADAWTTTFLERWALPIKIDPNWQKGDYYESQPPLAGLTAALMFITQDALTPAYFNQQGETLKHQSLAPDVLNDINAEHVITAWLRKRAEARAQSMDANHLLYLVRACQLFLTGQGQDLATGLARIQAKTLFIPATDDLLLMPYHAREAHQSLVANQSDSQYVELQGDLGHLEGVIGIAKHAETIRQFLQD
ncbi:homoserine O-acetyltransferase [Alteromonas sp. ASW11-36]|uniref:Probable acyltransferase n=2 Tax=Alteromonas arenosi TaxID=3055817 RepID=A0ABT7SUJ1_9ALTE|nr:homoserine O-acetyltransferase [Alteromonas sp. ASW11-36]MDM7859851.1 homoserine O-acetyltransferase [Alteromonas sp. ASW11-36]